MLERWYRQLIGQEEACPEVKSALSMDRAARYCIPRGLNKLGGIARRAMAMALALCLICSLLTGGALAAQGTTNIDTQPGETADGRSSNKETITVDTPQAGRAGNISSAAGTTGADTQPDRTEAGQPSNKETITVDTPPAGQAGGISPAEGTTNVDTPLFSPADDTYLPAAAVCEICGEAHKTEDCPVGALRALLSALPDPDQVAELMAKDMPTDEECGRLDAWAAQAQGAMDAYGALTEQQQALAPEAQGIFDALMAAFRGNAITLSSPTWEGYPVVKEPSDDLDGIYYNNFVLTKHDPYATPALQLTGEAAVRGGGSKSGTVTIPAAVQRMGANRDTTGVGYDATAYYVYSINEIGENAFNGTNYRSTNVVLPDTIQKIGAGAFKGCRSVDAREVSNAVLKSAGSKAFADTIVYVGSGGAKNIPLSALNANSVIVEGKSDFNVGGSTERVISTGAYRTSGFGLQYRENAGDSWKDTIQSYDTPAYTVYLQSNPGNAVAVPLFGGGSTSYVLLEGTLCSVYAYASADNGASVELRIQNENDALAIDWFTAALVGDGVVAGSTASPGLSLSTDGIPTLAVGAADSPDYKLRLGDFTAFYIDGAAFDKNNIGLTKTEAVTGGSGVGSFIAMLGTTYKRTTGTPVVDRAFTLRAGDSLYASISLGGTPAPENKITSFDLGANQSGDAVITNYSDSGAITVYMKPDTDVTALTPTITVSDGATVSPASGAAQNFTSPAAYTVTASDQTTRVYTVNVVVRKSNPPTVDTASKTIYANGGEVHIVEGNSDYGTDSNILYDANNDGVIGNEEYLKIGSNEPSASGYDLREYTVYGGAKDTEAAGTKIVMLGGQVGTIYGGGQEAAAKVTGNVSVALKGGTVNGTGNKSDGGSLYGGGYNGPVTGNINLVIEGTKCSDSVYGGGLYGAVEGSISTTMTGGTVTYIYGGGRKETATVGGDTAVTITGGKVDMSVYGGGSLSTVTGKQTITLGKEPVLSQSSTNGIRFNGTSDKVANGVDVIHLSEPLTGNAKVGVLLPKDFAPDGIIATGAVSGDIGHIVIAAGTVSGRQLYLDGADIRYGTPPASYTVAFDSQGGSACGPVTVLENRTAGALPTPAKDGMRFGGWYTEVNGGGEAFTSATPVTASITVYANWTAKSGDAKLAGFSVSGRAGVIDHDAGTVTVTLPAGSDSSGRRQPSITLSGPGARVSPADGQWQDFSQPVRYTVTAEDGAQKVYTVTVRAATCTCVLSAPVFEGGAIEIPSNASSATKTLSATGAVLSGDCEVEGHAGATVAYRYAVKTDAESIAAIAGDVLTVTGPGTVTVTATASANGVTSTADAAFTVTKAVERKARTTGLDLTGGSVTYAGADGEEKTANPTTTNITDTAEGWAWYHTAADGHEGNTLVLTGLDLTGCVTVGAVDCALAVPAGTTIVLKAAANTLKSEPAGSGDGACIHALGGLAIQGSGALSATVAGSGKIDCRALNIPGTATLSLAGDVTVTAEASSQAGECYGVASSNTNGPKLVMADSAVLFAKGTYSAARLKENLSGVSMTQGPEYTYPASFSPAGYQRDPAILTYGGSDYAKDVRFALITDAERLAKAKEAAEAALGTITATTQTAADDVLNPVSTAVTKLGTNVTAAWKDPGDFQVTPPQPGKAGSVTGTIILTLNGETVSVRVSLPIAALALTVTFDSNGGAALDPGSVKLKTSEICLGALLPKPPAYADDSKVFIGWRAVKDGGVSTEFTANTPVTGDMTVYAAWVDAAEVPALPILQAQQQYIFGNGCALVIEQDDTGAAHKAGKVGTTIYLDLNRDGVRDKGEPSLQTLGLNVLDGADLTQSASGWRWKIYGGSCEGAVDSTKITMNGGSVVQIYGGGGGDGWKPEVTGGVEITVKGGKVSSLYGGCEGDGNSAGVVEGDIRINVEGGDISQIYGGSDLYVSCSGTVQNIAIHISGGKVGSVHGGCHVDNATPSPLRDDVAGSVTITMDGGEVGSICGGGRLGGVKGDTFIVVNGGAVSGSVYGGGDSASVQGSTHVAVNGGTVDGAVYGAGNGSSYASVARGTNITMTGGTVGGINGGGSDGGGSVLGGSNITVTGGTVATSVAFGSKVNGVKTVTVGGGAVIGRPALDSYNDARGIMVNGSLTREDLGDGHVRKTTNGLDLISGRDKLIVEPDLSGDAKVYVCLPAAYDSLRLGGIKQSTVIASGVTASDMEHLVPTPTYQYQGEVQTYLKGSELRYGLAEKDDGSGDIKVTGVTVAPSTLTLVVGKSRTLTAAVQPENATRQGVAWSSSNPAVAAVDANGRVTAAAGGTALITAATLDGGFTASCQVTVEQAARFTVTFAGGDGAVGTPPVQADAAAGDTFTLPANPFTKAGHTFNGWSDGKNTYPAGAPYVMPGENVAFTAQWKKDAKQPVITGWGEFDFTKWYGATEVTVDRADYTAAGETYTVTADVGTVTVTRDPAAGDRASITLTAVADNEGKAAVEKKMILIDPVIDDYRALVEGLTGDSDYDVLLPAQSGYAGYSESEKKHIEGSDLSGMAERIDQWIADKLTEKDAVERAAASLAEQIKAANTIEAIENVNSLYKLQSKPVKDALPQEIKDLLAQKAADAAAAKKVKGYVDRAETYAERKAAVEAYDALTDYAKTLLPQPTLDKIEQMRQDAAAIKDVLDKIDRADTLDKITDALESYEKLTQDQKDAFPPDAKAELDELVKRKDKVDAALDAIEQGVKPGASDTEITDGKAALDGLTDGEKALLPGGAEDAINGAYQEMLDKKSEAERSAAQFEKEVAQVKGDPAIDKINELEKMRNELSGDAWEKVSAGTKADYEELIAKRDDAQKVVDAIKDLQAGTGSIDDVKDGYGGLDETGKHLVDQAVGGNVGDIIGQAGSAGDAIKDIPSHGDGSSITDDDCASQGGGHTIADHRARIEAAKIAYEKLDDLGRALVPAAEREKLNREYAALMEYLEYQNTAPIQGGKGSVEVSGLAERLDTASVGAAPKLIIEVQAKAEEPAVLPKPSSEKKTLAGSVDVKLVAKLYQDPDAPAGSEPDEELEIQPAPGKTVVVKIPVPDNIKPDTLEIWHVKDSGAATRIMDFWTVTEADGVYAVFEVSSFSHFVFYAEQKAAAPSTPDYDWDDTAPSPAPKPAVPEADNGSVSLSPEQARPGDKVSVTPKSDEGYVVDKIVVTDKDGNEIPVTDNGDGSWSFVQPDGKVTITVTFKPASELPYTDVSTDDWFYGGVKYAYENGLMPGAADGGFSPYLPVSRGVMITALWRLAGAPEASGAGIGAFPDVAEGSYCAQAVAWGSENGVVKGYGDGAFGPEDAVTREQLALFLSRYARLKGMDLSATGDLSVFSGQPHPWAAGAVEWAVGRGILTGKGHGVLDPFGEATRAEAAVMLQRFMEP